jgi:preprotein translocase subunit SecA
MDRLGIEEGEVITHPMVTRSISKAQQRVEARNFSIRKHLLEYDDVMNQQREVIYDRRNAALHGENLREEILEMMSEFVNETVNKYCDSKEYPENWNWDGLRVELLATLMVDIHLNEFKTLTVDSLKDEIRRRAESVYHRKEKIVPEEMLRSFERFVYLRTLDEAWKEHLQEMDALREGISLRAYGQKDPLIEYKSEGYRLFIELLTRIRKETLKILFRAEVKETPSRGRMVPRRKARNITSRHEETVGMGFSPPPKQNETVPERESMMMGGPSRRRQPVIVGEKVGRNDPCPCGSGKKYKKCHGAV